MLWMQDPIWQFHLLHKLSWSTSMSLWPDSRPKLIRLFWDLKNLVKILKVKFIWSNSRMTMISIPELFYSLSLLSICKRQLNLTQFTMILKLFSRKFKRSMLRTLKPSITFLRKILLMMMTSKMKVVLLRNNQSKSDLFWYLSKGFKWFKIY